LNFGHVVEGRIRHSHMTLFNADISTATVTTEVDPPFVVKPAFCILEASKSKTIKFSYKPTQVGLSTSALSLSYGHKHHELNTSGTCGTCVVQSSVVGNVVDFGTQASMRRKTTCHVFFTNIGSLVLRMKRMSVVDVKHFDIRFVGIVPHTASHSTMTR
jgi:hypothetical protein